MSHRLSFVLLAAAGCMQTQSASLGAQEQTAPHQPQEDAAPIPVSDASAAPDRASSDPERPDEDELQEQERDAAHDEVHAHDAGLQDASASLQKDAQIAPAVDGGPDAAIAPPGRDAAIEDAGQQLNPICRIEPWHCL